MVTLRYDALHREVDIRERFRALISGHKNLRIHFLTIVSVLVFVLLQGSLDSGIAESLFVFACVLIMLVVLVFILMSREADVIRLRAFAKDNGLTYINDIPYDDRPGLIFQNGDSKCFTDILSGGDLDAIEIGNFTYRTGDGKSRTTHRHGFVRMKLPRRLPHMLLDSKRSNAFFTSLNSLVPTIDTSQRISLEGDFDKHFSVYAPDAYKRDALYIFTPDVMETLIHAANRYDCEIIDDDFYLYSDNVIKMTDERQIREMLGIIGSLSPELVDQSRNYRDANVGNRDANTIAQPGARLRKRLPAKNLILLTAFAVVFFVAIYLLFGYFLSPF